MKVVPLRRLVEGKSLYNLALMHLIEAVCDLSVLGHFALKSST